MSQFLTLAQQVDQHTQYLSKTLTWLAVKKKTQNRKDNI